MDNTDAIYPRFFRPAALALGLAAYVLFTWVLSQSGTLGAETDTYYQLVAIWVVGFALLLVAPARFIPIGDDPTILLRVLWCNIGVVAIAVLAPHTPRLIMLVIPLFGVFYSALHLKRSHVLLIALATWFFYIAAAAGLREAAIVGDPTESLVTVGFAFILCGGVLLGWEALRLKDKLHERNTELRSAMERLQDMALRDELTGVHNRRFLMDVLKRQKSLADRQQRTFTVCYCDLDHFKSVNDQFGHAMGDRVLSQFAQLARSVVRNVDYIARFGGEEFILVLVDADEQAARVVGERLRQKTGRMQIKEQGQATGLKLSVSIGVAEYRSGELVDEMLKRADAALYEAKRSGRDRVVVADRTAASF